MWERRKLVDFDADLSIRRQCALLEINRSGLYYKALIDDDSEWANLIREVYLSCDCRYGYRKITQVLRAMEQVINEKKVLRLMQEMNIQGLYPRRSVNTSIKDVEHPIYPYLLADVEINRPNQVWATDITYIRLNGFFMYLVVIMDLFSRYIIEYDLSHTLEVESSLLVLKNALKKGTPDIFNSDQGVQFTSQAFIELLKQAKVKISMDHKGRCFDNILVERFWRTLKQESIYYYRPETIRELEKCLADFIPWYNEKRLHQSLNYKTPAGIYLH